MAGKDSLKVPINERLGTQRRNREERWKVG
jgi:hypothetical protein